MKLKKTVLLLPLFLFVFASAAYCENQSNLSYEWTNQQPSTNLQLYELTENVVYNSAMPQVTEKDNSYSWGGWSSNNKDYLFSVKSATYTVIVTTDTLFGQPVYTTVPDNTRWTIDANKTGPAFSFVTANKYFYSPFYTVNHDFEHLTITKGYLMNTSTGITGEIGRAHV